MTPWHRPVPLSGLEDINRYVIETNRIRRAEQGKPPMPMDAYEASMLDMYVEDRIDVLMAEMVGSPDWEDWYE